VILPTKHIPLRQSLLGVGGILLRHLDRKRTFSELWERVRAVREVGNYQRFVLALDLLYAVDAIALEEGLLRRKRGRGPGRSERAKAPSA